jgi:membrane protein DedA with SNARE-associated domain
MLEPLIGFLQTVPWFWILVFAFLITFLENVFPPAPCDSFILFTGTLVGLKTVGFIPLLIFTTLGSVAGFVFMFWLGYEFGIKIVDSNKIKFINKQTLEKPEELFRRYGDYIIVLNRFLSGTRAVISFFAGLSKLNIIKTTILCSISALVWNIILIYLGIILGKNWRLADYYLGLYGKILLPVIIFIVLAFVLYKYLKSRKNKKLNSK